MLAMVPTMAIAKPDPAARSRGFRLFARTLGLLSINRVFMGLNSAKGHVGVDPNGSSTIGGGFWPRGTPNQFVFNSGLQVAGKVSNPGGAWDGDVEGAFFFDPKGNTEHGEEVQPVFNAVDPDDAAAWPDAAIVAENDPLNPLYNPVLLGLQSASQGDVWFMTWDGNSTLISGRQHPLGVAVESRGLGWNFPTGNEDIAYFIFTFYNITSRNLADYAGVRPALQQTLADLGARFQDQAEAQFNISIPDGGYQIDSLFPAFAADMDVSNAGTNFCSVNLPFAMGYCYEHTFLPAAGEFYGDPTIWGAPFFAGPGFVGVKYLRSPTGAGEINLFSNTLNPGTAASIPGLRDAANTAQLFRYLSGNINPSLGDQPCTFSPAADNICFIAAAAADARFLQSSTALTLTPGSFGSIVVAYTFAAPVGIPGFVPSGGTDVQPDDVLRLRNAGQLASGGANLIDSITGFVDFTDDGDGVVEQTEFTTVPGSLLNKALTAQVVFDNGFLLPFAPSVPNFYLIPGDNSVTIAWQPSASEPSGDPFFAIASDPGTPGSPNPLFDPNYRQFDVEGYRVYRGRVSAGSSLTLVAQFDYAGTFMRDYTGQVNPTSTCGPEFGPTFGGAACPVPFDYVQGSGIAPTVSIDYALVGEIIQVKLGTASRVETAAGDLLIIANSDTLLTGAVGGSFAALSDNGVPFSFEDRAVRNNFQYFYAVVAFDVNSFQSGPASLESARVTKAVTPVAQSTNVGGLPDLSFEVTDANGDPFVETPFTIDATTGIFSGPAPAVAAATVRGVAFQGAQTLWPALGVGDLVATIDSVRVRGDGEDYPDEGIAAFDCQGISNGQGLCAEYFLTYRQPGKPDVGTRTVFYQPILGPVFGDDPEVTGTTSGAAVPFDDAQLARFDVPPGVGSLQAAADLSVGQYARWTAGENFLARRVNGGRSPGGARWFSGANETTAHPAYSYRAGVLPGVDTIFAPLAHINRVAGAIAGASVCMQVYTYGVATFGRSADIEVVWGTAGAVTIRDLSNNLPITFNNSPSTGYGFVQDGNGNGNVDWSDIAWTEDMIQVHNHLGFCASAFTGGTVSLTSPSRSLDGILPEPGSGLSLSPTATVTPVSVSIPGNPAPANFVPSGSGIGLYVAGHYYVMQLTGGTLPAPGTRWVLRTYHGDVTSSSTTATATPANYVFTPQPSSPNVGGLRINYVTGTSASDRPATSFDLTRVHTVPDPYFVTNGYESTTDNKVLQFVNLPNQAIIRIYTSSGILVNVLEHNSQQFGGGFNWNLRNRNNQVVASGVYFYHVESGDARRVGRFTVVNFAQ
jgi:hypothetical protein